MNNHSTQRGFTRSLENGIAHMRNGKPMPFFSAGFTLIELLVVISIIGILSAIILVNLTSSRQKANDAKIKTQLVNIRSQAEVFFHDQNPNSYGTASNLCSGAGTLFANSAVAALLNGLPSGVTPTCRSTTSGYSLYAPLQSVANYSWCVDYTGYSNMILTTSAPGAGDITCL